MGVLIDGAWHDGELPQETGAGGEFQRADSRFRDRITADGSSGFKAEAGRYHLYVAHGCPWAHRTLIYRVGQEAAGRDHRFVLRARTAQAGLDFRARSCVPGLHSGHGQRLPLSAPGLHRQRSALYRQGHGPDLVGQEDPAKSSTTNSPKSSAYSTASSPTSPATIPTTIRALRDEIDRLNEIVYANVNNGVYRCGFARSQAAYEAAYDALFATLDELEVRLSRQRYLAGGRITEADWRLFPTLVRFDVAYFSLFRCNRQRIADYPNLLNYMRELYHIPGIAETVKARYYVINYWSIARLNPAGIIPKGTPVDFTPPHDRARLAN